MKNKLSVLKSAADKDMQDLATAIAGNDNLVIQATKLRNLGIKAKKNFQKI